MSAGKSFHARWFTFGLFAVLAAGSLAPLQADIYRPGDDVPKMSADVFTWGAGADNSTFAEWDDFDSDVLSDADSLPVTFAPDVGSSGNPASLDINFNTSIVTSTSNIYSFGPQSFTGSIDTQVSDGSHSRVVAQFFSTGPVAEEVPGKLLINSVSLSDETGQSFTPSLFVETSRGPSASPFGGEDAYYLSIWDLETSQTKFDINFMTPVAHVALNQFRIDTFTQDSPFVTPTAIPEPASFAALGVFGLSAFGFVTVRRRRKAAAARG